MGMHKNTRTRHVPCHAFLLRLVFGFLSYYSFPCFVYSFFDGTAPLRGPREQEVPQKINSRRRKMRDEDVEQTGTRRSSCFRMWKLRSGRFVFLLFLVCADLSFLCKVFRGLLDAPLWTRYPDLGCFRVQCVHARWSGVRQEGLPRCLFSFVAFMSRGQETVWLSSSFVRVHLIILGFFFCLFVLSLLVFVNEGRRSELILSLRK